MSDAVHHTEYYFVLRFWLEPRIDQAKAPHWRGRVRHGLEVNGIEEAVDDPEQAFDMIRHVLGIHSP